MRDVVLIDAIRTPCGRGKPGGALAGVHPTDLLAGVLADLIERTGVDPAAIDDVIAGCVSQAGEQTFNIARNALLGAGLPESVPGVTIDRQCGSSQQAVTFAAQAIASGMQDVVIACGVESMSRVPLRSSLGGRDPYGSRVAARYPDGLVEQGVSAELVAARWGIGRAELDAYAAQSHRRAEMAWDDGLFAREVVPVAGVSLARDETLRSGTTAESLAALAPAFESAEKSERFPEITWSITAGSSSPLSDGASAALLMSAETANALGLRPRARFAAFATVGSDPLLMLTGVIPATYKAMALAGLSLDELTTVEVNEAFASVPLAWLREFPSVDPALLNPWGGAIALGHALGSSGTRLLATMLTTLEHTGGRYGLQTMCEGGGMANATIIERLG
ncbi:thiolase family protein [Microbacteriaceae bacterium VKM Ac-2855]|nr:thiolase family protein [Microbacteriaceae bacterium VKM Ac-2855]